jgi:hypothetical protein
VLFEDGMGKLRRSEVGEMAKVTVCESWIDEEIVVV